MGGMGETRQQRDRPAGRGMVWLGALGLLAGLTALFSAVGPGRGGIVQGMTETGRGVVVVQRDRSGHYLAEGAINGIGVSFLLDTGATDVAIPAPLARELGLEFGPEVMVMTAAGPVQAWMTRLDRVSIGQLSLRDVRGTITRGPLDEVLLGMSFLKHFRLTQQGDQLIIESEA
jgi:aspartyl protease family protein